MTGSTMLVADPSSVFDASSSAFDIGVPDSPATNPSTKLEKSRYPGIRFRQTIGTVRLSVDALLFEPDEDDDDDSEEGEERVEGKEHKPEHQSQLPEKATSGDKPPKEAPRCWHWAAIDKHEMKHETDADGDEVPVIKLHSTQGNKVVKLYVCAGSNIADALSQDVDRRLLVDRRVRSGSSRLLAVDPPLVAPPSSNNANERLQQLAEAASPSQKKILYQRGSIMVLGGGGDTGAPPLPEVAENNNDNNERNAIVEDPAPKSPRGNRKLPTAKMTSLFSSKTVTSSSRQINDDDDDKGFLVPSKDHPEDDHDDDDDAEKKKAMFALFTPAGSGATLKNREVLVDDDDDDDANHRKKSTFRVSDLLMGCILAPPKAVRDRQENIRTSSRNVSKPSMLEVLIMAPPPKRKEAEKSRRNLMSESSRKHSEQDNGGKPPRPDMLSSSSGRKMKSQRKQQQQQKSKRHVRNSHDDDDDHDDDHRSDRSLQEESCQPAFDDSAGSQGNIMDHHGRRHPTKHHHHAIDSSARSSSSTTPVTANTAATTSQQQHKPPAMSLGRRISLIVTPQRAAEEIAKEEAKQRELEAAIREAEEKRLFFAPTAPTKLQPALKRKSTSERNKQLTSSTTSKPNNSPTTPESKGKQSATSSVTWSPSQFEVEGGRRSGYHRSRDDDDLLFLRNKSEKSSHSGNRARHVRTFSASSAEDSHHEAPASAPTATKPRVREGSLKALAKLPFAPLALEENDLHNNNNNTSNPKGRRTQMSKEMSQVLQSQPLDIFHVPKMKDDTATEDGADTNIISMDGDKTADSSLLQHKRILESSQANLDKLANIMALVNDVPGNNYDHGEGEEKAEIDSDDNKNKESSRGKFRDARRKKPPTKAAAPSPASSTPSRLVVDGSIEHQGKTSAPTTNAIARSHDNDNPLPPYLELPSRPQSRQDSSQKPLSYYRDTYFSKKNQSVRSLQPLFVVEATGEEPQQAHVPIVGHIRRGSAPCLSLSTPAELEARHHRFVLLRHAATCTVHNIDDTHDSFRMDPSKSAPKDTCKLDPECSELKVVLRHVRTCDNPSCVFPNCRDSKALLLSLHQQTQQSRRLRELQQQKQKPQDSNNNRKGVAHDHPAHLNPNLWHVYMTAMRRTSPPLEHVEVTTSDDDDHDTAIVSVMSDGSYFDNGEQ